MNFSSDPGARAGWLGVGVAGEGAPWGPTEPVPSLPCAVWAGLRAGVCSWAEADGQLHVPLPCREMCWLFLRRLLELVAPASLAFSLGAF